MGDRSQGVTASTIDRILPFSGIELRIYSNIQNTLDGTNFENEGVAVDVEIVDDWFNGADNMLFEVLGC